MKKTFVIVVTAIIFLITSNVQAQTKFKDISKSHWAHDEIMFLTGRGLIKGLPNGNFAPDKGITRLQAVTIILREKGITYFSGSPDIKFSDIKEGDYGYDIVTKAVQLGIIDGKTLPNGKKVFDPNGKLTRAQMSKILSNAYKLKGKGSITFKDVPKKSWAYEYIKNTTVNKVTTGYNDGTFRPNNNVTRAQFAVMMARLLDGSFIDGNHKPFNRSELMDMLIKDYDYTRRGNTVGFNLEEDNDLVTYDVLYNLGDISEIYITIREWDRPEVNNSELIPLSISDGLKMIIPSGASKVYDIVETTAETGNHPNLNVEYKYDGYKIVVVSGGNNILVKLVK